MKLAFITVLIVLLILPLVYGSVGLGVSDYDSHVLVSSPTTIPICKVTNTGNVTLIFNYVWKQTNATVNMTLPVTPTLTNYTLQPDQSFEPTITIGNYNTSFTGNYSGFIEIKGSYPIEGSGSQVVPAGLAHVTLIVDLPPDPQQPLHDNIWILIVLVACIIAIMVCINLAYNHIKTRRRHS